MKPRFARSTSVLAAATALLFAPDCTTIPGALESGSAGGGGDDTGGVVLSAAAWTLAWDRDGITLDAEGGWSVQTDLGYRVALIEGWLVDYSVSFGPCDVTQAESTAWLRWLPIRSAWAHNGELDASAIEMEHVQDLGRPADGELGTSGFAPVRYCRVHSLVARASGPAAAPGGPDMAGYSVRLWGTWERDGIASPFSVQTWWPQGRLADMEEAIDADALAEAEQDGATRFAFVTIHRPLGRLFDGIDFATATEAEIAGRLLDNLAGGTRLHVDLWAPSAP